MNIQDILRGLSKIDGSQICTLSPGPVKIRTGPSDALAARLLLWLFGQCDDDTTSGELLDALGDAVWWFRFLMNREMDKGEEQEAAADDPTTP